MIISTLTQTPVTTTGTVTVKSRLLAGYKLNADGTNLATLVLKDGGSSGSVMFDTNSVIGEHVISPMRCSGVVYYSVSGTNADLMLFEGIREDV